MIDSKIQVRVGMPCCILYWRMGVRERGTLTQESLYDKIWRIMMEKREGQTDR
jgi:hypothetical protein